MTDFQQNAFTIWGNFNRDKEKPMHYWAQMEVPVEELRSLMKWAESADRVQNMKGDECVKLRANLMPRQSKAGNDYLLMALSNAKPKTASANDAPF